MPAENLNADAKAIFWEALEIASSDERDAYVRQACEGNPSLLAAAASRGQWLRYGSGKARDPLHQ